jgi:hypothetical protein
VKEKKEKSKGAAKAEAGRGTSPCDRVSPRHDRHDRHDRHLYLSSN